ncbi:nitrogenase component 1 [Thermosulfurimonas dismutans]|uniref:Nitrogenase FeMo-cofactor scaffold and assembly protein NifE n=1 Tax=Thermosulfurimonas dismutans TaxID=999894 RepID=A0A179D4T5_9BACT|nr:nitrogenase component 1 [Thermosulfurimonas dismutans]OAQ21100.1 Nitrogenase FeMo-cofactor scaffold and assembly protein NifE [Thermosulfurimonas dismutans]
MRSCGNYGCMPLRIKPCGLASEPGGMTQRSCVYFGARYVLGPIREAVHLVHGPVGCGYYGAMVRGEAKDLFGTALTAGEIIFGGLDKLRKALHEAFALRPSARGAFLYATCTTGLIGEDLAGLAREIERESGRRIVVVDCPGFSGKSQAGGHAVAYRSLLNLVRPFSKAEHPTVNLIGEYNVAGEAREIKRLLEKLGVKVHTVLTGDTRFSEIERLSRAHLNLLFCGSTAREFASALKERFGLPYLKVSFYGLSAVGASLRKVGEALGLSSDKVEDLIREEETRTFREIRSWLKLFSGKRVLVVLGAGRLGPLGRMLRELGFEVIGAASVFGSSEDHQEAAPFSGFLTDDPGDDEFERALSMLKPDLVITNAREQWRAVKLGFPTLSFPQERRRGPYTGYQGFVNFVYSLVRVLRAPVWRLKAL